MRFPIFAFFTAAILLLTQACGKPETPRQEEACHFQQNSYLQRVSWAWKTPIKMYADSSLSAEQITALEKALQIWNETLESKGLRSQVFSFAGVVEGNQVFKEDRKNVVSLATPWLGKSTEQAETLVRWEGDRIVEADIRINGEKPLSTSDGVESGKFDLVALYVHELGHVLGLLHIEEGQYSTMAEHLDAANVKRRTIGDLELDALRCEY